MTSGNSVLPLRFLLVAAMLSAACMAMAETNDSLRAVMNSLHAVTSASGTFTEKKYLSIASEPLESSGRLVYTAPDRLEKTTLQPDRQSLVVTGDELIVTNGASQQRKLKLSEHPEIKAFVESVRATLSGNIDGLYRYYDVSFDGDVGQWTLKLRPTAKQMKDRINMITLQGGNGHLQSVAVDEADGDRSVMTITPSKP